MVKVSVVICTTLRNELKKCLRSIEEQSFNDFEILLISNKEIPSELFTEKTKFIKTESKNLSQQRNEGIKKSEGDILVFADDDVVASEHWLEELVKHYDDSDVMCVGGRVNPDFEEESEIIGELDKHIFYGLIGATFIEGEKPRELKSPLLWGCNISFRKKIFDEVGYFPEELGRSEGKLLSDEERFIELKVLEEEYKIIYEPEAIVEHKIDAEQLTEKYLIERSYWQGVSEIKRFRISNRDKLSKFPDFELLKDLTKIRLLEKQFEFYSSNKLKSKIDLSREIGRLVGIQDLVDDIKSVHN